MTAEGLKQIAELWPAILALGVAASVFFAAVRVSAVGLSRWEGLATKAEVVALQARTAEQIEGLRREKADAEALAHQVEQLQETRQALARLEADVSGVRDLLSRMWADIKDIQQRSRTN